VKDNGYPAQPEPLAGPPVYDSHCHLDIGRDGRADGEGAGSEGEVGPLGVADAVQMAQSVGVAGIVQIGCDLASARWSVAIAETTPGILAGVALHPNEAPALASKGRDVLTTAWDEIDALAAHPRVRAVGETGLDFFRTPPEGRAVQEESFRRHIGMAKAHDKALVIHDRDAHAEVVGVLDSEGAPDRVVFHCFSGGPELAKVCAQRGWFMSFAGPVTFKNAANLRAALAVAPPELVLVETDAPFLTPEPFRGRPNASYLVPLTVRAMAAVLDLPEAELAARIAANSVTVFGDFR
jgi:TatD DNase family protein